MRLTYPLAPAWNDQPAPEETETDVSAACSGVDPNGALDERVLNDYQDFFVRVGTQQQKLDSSRVIDRTYVDYALQRLGRLTP